MLPNGYIPTFFEASLSIYVIGAFRCGTCLLLVGVQNPIHSILLLIMVFFLGTLLLFFLEFDYFSRLFLIVYVGAIVVLFLFIIRRLELKRVNISNRFRDLVYFRYFILGFFLLELVFFTGQNYFDLTFYNFNSFTAPFFIEVNNYINWAYLTHQVDQLHAVGNVLYTDYKVTPLLAAILLFISRVGALVITQSTAIFKNKKVFQFQTRSSIKYQLISFQIRRHPKISFFQKKN